MTKSDLIGRLGDQLAESIRVLKASIGESRESATGEETKSEGKYDTRAIEAAYLAEGQRKQLAAMEEARRVLENFEPQDFAMDEAIELGALVEVEREGELVFYLLAPMGGGVTAEYLGCEVTVITPESRVFGELLGKECGEELAEFGIKVLGVE